MDGKNIIISMAERSIIINGITDLYMSIMVIPLGATPFITKRHRPKGGVVIPICILINVSKPNQIGSKPRARTIGMNIGKVIIMIETCSIKVPKITIRACITIIMMSGDMSKLTTTSTRPLLAPVKASIWLKAVDPVRIMNIITVIWRVDSTDFLMIVQVIFLYRMIRRAVVKTPIPADSVGVANPAKIRPVTTIIILAKGMTFIASAEIFSDHGIFSGV